MAKYVGDCPSRTLSNLEKTVYNVLFSMVHLIIFRELLIKEQVLEAGQNPIFIQIYIFTLAEHAVTINYYSSFIISKIH